MQKSAYVQMEVAMQIWSVHESHTAQKLTYLNIVEMYSSVILFSDI